MNPPDLDPGYKLYPPKLSRFWSAVLRPLHLYSLHHNYKVREITLEGDKHLKRAVASGAAVLITPNHSFHGDAIVLCEALRDVGVRCHYMAAWQVFRGLWGVKARMLQRMGVFSVDREGNDLKAFRLAVELLAAREHPLVIFPEGEVYHINDRITPLRDGAAMIALAALRRIKPGNRTRPGSTTFDKATQPVAEPHADGGTPASSNLYCVPCALKAFYLEDPTHALEAAMNELERRIYWRPQRDRPLEQRIYKYAAALLSLKEREYTDRTSEDPLPQRLAALIDFILANLERAYFGQPKTTPVPVRIKELRRCCLSALDVDTTPPASCPRPDPERVPRDLEDLHFVTQLFSYPGDYVAERPTIERLAETVHKFREDALGVHTAVATHPLRVVVKFGEPIDVGAFSSAESTPPAGQPDRAARSRARQLAPRLTQEIEQRIQRLLDALCA